MLQIVNKLSLKKKTIEKTPARTSRFRNPDKSDQPKQLPMSSLSVEFTVPLKYQRTFWRSLDLPVITCEIELDF